MQATIKIDQVDMLSKIMMIWAWVHSIIIRPLEGYTLTSKLAKRKDQIFLFKEEAGTSAAKEMTMDSNNIEVPTTAELIAKVNTAVTAELKKDIEEKDLTSISQEIPYYILLMCCILLVPFASFNACCGVCGVST